VFELRKKERRKCTTVEAPRSLLASELIAKEEENRRKQNKSFVLLSFGKEKSTPTVLEPRNCLQCILIILLFLTNFLKKCKLVENILQIEAYGVIF